MCGHRWRGYFPLKYECWKQDSQENSSIVALSFDDAFSVVSPSLQDFFQQSPGLWWSKEIMAWFDEPADDPF